MKKLILFSWINIAALTFANAAVCTQTVSVGASLPSLISSAANDAVICLNSGNYGTVNLTNISRTGFVTIQSASGKGATINPRVNRSNNIKFESLTISGATIENCARNIEIRGSDFTDSLGINNYSYTCTNYPLNIVIDGNNVPEVGPAFSEGRIDIRDKDGGQGNMGVTISNNYISGGCLSDGVQVTGGASGVTITGNHFDNIIQTSGPEPKPHCDAIQFYGSGNNNSIIGNWFRNCSSVLQNAEASDNTILRNNVFQNGYNSFNSDFGGTMVIEHNTIYNQGTIFRVGPNATATIRDNLFIGGNIGGFHTDTCFNCTISNNLKGNPTFVGGSNPNSFDSFSDWALAPGSFGKNAGTDGKDIGVIIPDGPATGTYHPADINPRDWVLSLNECTAFGSCWRSNCNSSAIMENAVRAGYLWNASVTGQYHYNSTGCSGAACWEVGP